MDSLADYIQRRQTRGRPVYMPYLTVGDPNFDATVEFALGMIDAGADLIELGIPFSDPTADGPVIQAAMVRALARPDFSLENVLNAAGRIHAARPEIPLIFLSYLNPVMRGFAGGPGEGDGLLRFLTACRDAGIRGLVLPDLPFDQPEAERLRFLAEPLGIAQILMVTPNTGERRFRGICKHGRGFLYYVTSYGVTGERQELPPDLAESIRRVRTGSKLPVLAGFGINRPDQVRELKSIVDGVIVGSLHHRIIEELAGGAAGRLRETTSAFVEALGSPMGRADS